MQEETTTRKQKTQKTKERNTSSILSRTVLSIKEIKEEGTATSIALALALAHSQNEEGFV